MRRRDAAVYHGTCTLCFRDTRTCAASFIPIASLLARSRTPHGWILAAEEIAAMLPGVECLHTFRSRRQCVVEGGLGSINQPR